MQQYANPSAVEMAARMNQIRQWLDTSAAQWCSEQRHLDEGTAERAYWHMGYLAALADAQAMCAAAEANGPRR